MLLLLLCWLLSMSQLSQERIKRRRTRGNPEVSHHRLATSSFLPIPQSTFPPYAFFICSSPSRFVCCTPSVRANAPAKQRILSSINVVLIFPLVRFSWF